MTTATASKPARTRGSRTWIIGSTSYSRWHIGVSKQSSCGAGRYWVTACNGRMVGGAYGPGTYEIDVPNETEHARCVRCAQMAGVDAVPVRRRFA